MYLVLAGNVTHEANQRLAAMYFGDLEPAETASAQPGTFGEVSGEQLERDIQQANICLAMPGPSHRDPQKDVVVARMMSAILGGSMSSRLFISVRERQGLCYSVSSSLDMASDIGAVMIYTGTDPDKAGTAVQSIVEEMRLLVRGGITTEELEKGQAMLKGRYVLDREDSMAMGYLAAAELLYRGRAVPQARAPAPRGGGAARAGHLPGRRGRPGLSRLSGGRPKATPGAAWDRAASRPAPPPRPAPGGASSRPCCTGARRRPSPRSVRRCQR
jgi:predicted Zn-dependent peptidase